MPELHHLFDRAPGRPLVMGILNVTPDSFSDGGAYFEHGSALEHALAMIEQGAAIIDIGGESTRPAGAAYGGGATQVTTEEELLRVMPLVQEIRSHAREVMVSVDTQKSAVANAALHNGADLINDVSAGTTDPKMFSVAAKHKAPIILMHGHGPRFRKPRIEEYQYDDVVREVNAYLSERILLARSAGVEHILADVGIGFAKGYADNMRLLRCHAEFESLGVPLVLGVSRKSSIGIAMAEGRPSEAPPAQERMIGSVAAACYGVLHGARIIRTHDVKETREALAVIGAIDRS